MQDIKEDKIYTSVSSSHITAKSSYADNLEPLDLNADPPDLPNAKEAVSQWDGMHQYLTNKSDKMGPNYLIITKNLQNVLARTALFE
jgi:hypothetical protein